jgi:recombination protein RecT
MARDLAQRTETAVAQQKQQPTVAQMIHDMKHEIARALPRHMDPDRLARMALTVFRQNQKLQECKPESFIGALMTCSQLGLEPGPLGEAYFVPYGREVTFIPGYRGLIKLAWQSGQLRSIAAEIVRENDDFDFELGSERSLHHSYSLTDEDRGRPIGVYAAAEFKNGGKAFWVMSLAEIEAIRKQSKAANNGPWVTHWDAMARKTAIRQLVRYLPLSTELQNLAMAAQLDESVRTDITTPLDEATVGYIAGETVNTETGEVSDVTVTSDQPEEPEGW